MTQLMATLQWLFLICGLVGALGAASLGWAARRRGSRWLWAATLGAGVATTAILGLAWQVRTDGYLVFESAGSPFVAFITVGLGVAAIGTGAEVASTLRGTRASD